MKIIITVILSLVIVGNLFAKEAKPEKLRRVSLSSIVKNDEDFLVKWGDKKFIATFRADGIYKDGSPNKTKAKSAEPEFVNHGVIVVDGKKLEWAGKRFVKEHTKKRMKYICSVHMGKDAVIRLLIHTTAN